MEQLVDHRGRHVLQCSALRLGQVFQIPRQRFLEFFAADVLETLPQSRDCGNLFQRIQPSDEGLGFNAHDLFSFFRLGGTRLQIFFGDTFEIIDIVEVDVVEIVDLRIKVSSEFI